MKILVLICVLATSSSSLFASDSIEHAPTDSIFVAADINPYFPGCEDDLSPADHNQCSQRNLFQWISRQLKYPQSAREAGIQGSVIMSFVVNKDGSTDAIKILKDPGGGLGNESKRIIQLMQKEIEWSPARKNDQAVAFRYVLPIKFKLGDTKETYLAFKAWGGREVFRGMVDVAIQDRIPFKLIKNIETLDFKKSKDIYNVIGKVNIIHFRPKKLARPQELIGIQPSNIDKMPFSGVAVRAISNLNQLNITINKVDSRITYYVHSYVGEVFKSGTIARSNGIIEKVDISKAPDGVLFVSFVHDDRYYSALCYKESE